MVFGLSSQKKLGYTLREKLLIYGKGVLRQNMLRINRPIDIISTKSVHYYRIQQKKYKNLEFGLYYWV